MTRKLNKLTAQLGNIHHVLLAGFLIFIINQCGQIPTANFNNHPLHDLGLAIIALIFYGIALYWSYALISQNTDLDTHRDIYSSIKTICWLILLCLVLNQLWAYEAIKWLHLTTGSATSSNQAAINAMANTTAGTILEWITVILVGPVTEEIFFRYAVIRPKGTISKAKQIIFTIISILLFATLHMIIQLLSIHTTAQAKAATFSLGQYLIIATIFSLNYYFRNNIKENIAMHMSYNTLALLLTL